METEDEIIRIYTNDAKIAFLLFFHEKAAQRVRDRNILRIRKEN